MAKKIPMRQCLGCREMKPKPELLRVVRSPEGEVRYDPTGKANGRGAYLCADPACVAAAKKKKSLSRALKTEVPESVYEELAALCEKMGNEA